VDETMLRNWLEAYGRAWQERNPLAAAELYAEDGTYQVTPFLEPIRGREAIRAYWQEVTATEKDISFSYEILAATERFGIARWRASFERTPPGLKTKLDGIFLIELDASRKCSSLQEWWHKQQ
jgi:ketosteroid isomerase-like protein